MGLVAASAWVSVADAASIGGGHVYLDALFVIRDGGVVTKKSVYLALLDTRNKCAAIPSG